MRAGRLVAAVSIVALLGFGGGPLVDRADAVRNGFLVTPERYESEWPWSVALRVVDTESGLSFASCTGSLIAPAWVLTAAHCVVAYQDDDLTVQVVHGAPDVNDATAFTVDGMSFDPAYDDAAPHDVALLHLTADPGPPYAPLLIDSTSPNPVHPNMDVEIAGWGFADPGESVELEREGTAHLSAVGGGALLVNPAPSSACFGDSGGPVVVRLDDGRRAVVGVESRGDEHCLEHTEDADVRVSAAYITAHTGPLPELPPTVLGETLPGLVEDAPGGSMDVLANDVDPDGGTLSIVAARPLNGTGGCTLAGVCSFEPEHDVSSDLGLTGVSYVVHDGRGRLAIGFMSAEVAPAPDPPEVTLIDGTTSGPAPLDAAVFVASSDIDGTTISEMDINADYGDGSPSEPVTLLGFVDDQTVAIASHQYLEPGTFTVGITIEDPDGLTDSATTTVTVTPGPPQLTVGDVAVSETGGSATLHAHLSAPPTGAVGVSFLSSENTAFRDDFEVTDGVLTFAPGVTDVAVPIKITNDRRVEGDETFDVFFSIASGAAVAVDPNAAVTIHDDEAPAPPADRAPTLLRPYEVYDYEVPLAPGESSVELGLTDPVTASDEGGSVPVTCNHALDPGVFAVGTTTVKCSATDPTGHTRKTSFKVVIRATGDAFGDFDPLSPTITVGNVSAVEESGHATVPISMSPTSVQMQFVQVDVVGSATDVVPTRFVRTLLPGETADSIDVVLRNDKAAEVDVISLVANAFGPLAISGSVTVTDGDVDTRAPAVSTHAERFLSLVPVSTALPVAIDNYGFVDAYDEHDGPLPVVCTPAAGALFPKGTTTVSCTATDSAGLVGRLRLPVVVKQI